MKKNNSNDYGFTKKKQDEGQLKKIYEKNTKKFSVKKVFTRASGKR